jgi:probable rRNA maturation factor
VEGEVISEQDNSDEEEKSDNNHYDSDDEYEYEYMEIEVDEYDDRGIAPNMQYIYDPEIRIHMLIVHGMLHLVGYDHIEDNDYELMVVREDEVLAELKRRLGDDFGLGRARALPKGEVR